MLKSLDGLPISKLNIIQVPAIKSEFGDVKLGSALSYQVCHTIHCSTHNHPTERINMTYMYVTIYIYIHAQFKNQDCTNQIHVLY